MRRFGMVLMVLAVAGCSALRDAFTAHPSAAAEADGQRITVEQLAQLAARVKGMPLQQSNLSRLASAYLDYILVATALVNGSVEDSGVIAEAMWPMIAQRRFDRFMERQNAGLGLNDHQIDSTYRAGDLRAFQHILIRVPPNAAPPVVRQKQRLIDSLQRAVKHGASFAQLARRNSDDPGSKVSGGYLSVGGRGRFVPAFEDAAWQLAPGELSGVVRSGYGFHLIRRPPLAEIRDSFTVGVTQVLAERFDSSYMADIMKRRELHVSGSAAEDVRKAVQDPDHAVGSHRELARFRGGDFKVKDLMRWLYAVDPRVMQSLPSAPDSELGQVVQRLAERAAALQEADSAHVQLADSDWAAIHGAYDSSLVLLRQVLQLDSGAIHDSAAGVGGPAAFGAVRVQAYFERLVGGQAGFLPVPPLLALALRERASWSIDQAGVRRATEQAIALRASADSLGRSGAGNGRSGLRPAPGPAPLGTAVDSALKRPPDHRVVE